MTSDHIWASGWNDQSYMTLINSINQGFPSKCSLTESDIQNFWEVWHQLSTERDLVLMDGRIVIPKSFWGKTICCLHSAYHGMDGMDAHANDLVYWPGINMSIWNFRANWSISCNHLPQANHRNPLLLCHLPNGWSNKY